MRDGREVWAQRVQRLRDSDLTTAEFAAALGINPRTLTYWKWRLGKEERLETERNGRKKPKAMFVEVTAGAPAPVGGAPPIEIVLDGRIVVRVPRDFDAEVLRRVVALLASGAA